MGVLPVTSIHAGDGKTALLAALGLDLMDAGKRVSYLKCQAAEGDIDVRFLAKLLGESSVQALGGMQSAGQAAKEAVERLGRGSDAVLVELPPLFDQNEQTNDQSVNLAGALGTSILLVAGFRSGMGMDAVARAAHPLGNWMAGVLINGVAKYRSYQVQSRLVQDIARLGLNVLGLVPEDRTMCTVTVGQIAQHLNGQWVLGREKAGELVQHFMIGGNPMDWAVDYFSQRERKAVIVRGNRPDIQIAALSTDTACLILTAGAQPTEYVYHEANGKDVPVIVVQTGTAETADALHGLFKEVAVHHPRKAQRYMELLKGHTDIKLLEKLCN